MMEISLSQASQELRVNAKAKTVPLFLGSPGLGKSAIAHQFAAENGLKVIDLRLSSMLPEDLNGFPRFDNNKATFIPFDTFPLEGDPIPEGYNGWLLFLDELTSASKAVQAPAYKLILDRMVGLHKLHPNVVIACAGNKSTDRAITTPLSTALKSRLITYEISVNYKDWLQWANENDIDHRIRAFISFKPSSLMQFDPTRDDHTFASPRTWEFLSRLLKVDSEVSPDRSQRIAGTVGTEAAAEFISFASEFENLPDMEDILKDPEGTIVPPKSSTKYCVITVTADYLSNNYGENKEKGDEIIKPILTYISRFDPEFQVVFCRTIMARNPRLRMNRAITDFAVKYIREMN